MKNGIEPIWEHDANRNGGVCSFRIELNNFEKLWEELNIRMVSGTLSKDSEDITGLSISPKNSWAIIKIWNKNSNNDLSTTLPKDIIDKYGKFGIRYKPNSPEY